jgi:hypothetical protein
MNSLTGASWVKQPEMVCRDGRNEVAPGIVEIERKHSDARAGAVKHIERLSANGAVRVRVERVRVEIV